MARLVDHDSYQPVYKQLADILRERISTGELQPGARLPGEHALCQEHGIGRDTARDALAILRAEGLIVTEPRIGSRVKEEHERKVVKLKPGERLWVRMPTPDERRKHKIPEGVAIIIIESGDNEAIYLADRTAVE